MPNCFTLTRRSNLEAGPVVLQKIDDELREHFHAPPDKVNWFNGWYNYIGYFLAFGWSWTKLRQDIDAECLMSPVDSGAHKHWALNRDILDWLEANFTSDAWYELKK